MPEIPSNLPTGDPFSQDKDGMTLDHLFMIISSVATWITALLILFTLFEMGRQRRSSYKPQLVFPRKRFFAYWNNINNQGIPNLWLEKEEDIDLSKITFQPYTYTLTLYNVGLGSAMDINIKWEFDRKKLIKCINDNIPKGFAYIEEEDESGLWCIKRGGEPSVLFNLNNDLFQSYDYLLPTSIEHSGLPIHLPSCFIELISMVYGFLIRKMSNVSNLLPKIPSSIILILSISYKDIGNKHYKKTITLELTSPRLQYSKEGINGLAFSAVIKSRV